MKMKRLRFLVLVAALVALGLFVFPHLQRSNMGGAEKTEFKNLLNLDPPKDSTAFSEKVVYINNDAKVLFVFKTSIKNYLEFLSKLKMDLEQSDQKRRAISDMSYYYPSEAPKDIEKWKINYASGGAAHAVSLFYNEQNNQALVLLNPVD